MHRAREWLARKNQCAVKSRESPVGERNKLTRKSGLSIAASRSGRQPRLSRRGVEADGGLPKGFQLGIAVA